tara:strand:+ start:38839 stop:40380 length:1542 start_codon:yes stop_codon:yes gene_type:complete
MDTGTISSLLILLFVIGPLAFAIIFYKKSKTLKSVVDDEKRSAAELQLKSSALEQKYAPIISIDNYVAKVKAEAEEIEKATLAIREKAEHAASIITAHASKEKRELLEAARKQATETEQAAQVEHDRLLAYAREQAEQIAGDALDVKQNADKFSAVVTAMKNAIEGYRDDYIIPNHSVLDELADEYSHKDAGQQLKVVRDRIRKLVKEERAANCDYKEANRRETAIHFVIDAFNGKADSVLAKVKHNNYGKLRQEIIDAFAQVNFHGQPFRSARIEQTYLDARLEELKWAVTVRELQLKEKEEQREIREQMREEERVRKEIEKAMKEAQKEERLLQDAMQRARAELAQAGEDQRAQFEAQIIDLEAKLKAAEEKEQRAMSMAQQTRRGHVYVISNIGSFGEHTYKVGMTRRLEPLDRVKELGDASVPFSFDVHAIISAEDAPALEAELHRQFEHARVNKVNYRKEFFKTTLAEIRQIVEREVGSDVHWTMRAEAEEYRETLSLQKAQEAQKTA